MPNHDARLRRLEQRAADEQHTPARVVIYDPITGQPLNMTPEQVDALRGAVIYIPHNGRDEVTK